MQSPSLTRKSSIQLKSTATSARSNRSASSASSTNRSRRSGSNSSSRKHSRASSRGSSTGNGSAIIIADPFDPNKEQEEIQLLEASIAFNDQTKNDSTNATTTNNPDGTTIQSSAPLLSVDTTFSTSVVPSTTPAAASLDGTPRLRFETFPSKTDYRYDGDRLMDTDLMMSRRRKLKQDPQILKWINVFWRTFHHQQPKHNNENTDQTEQDGSEDNSTYSEQLSRQTSSLSEDNAAISDANTQGEMEENKEDENDPFTEKPSASPSSALTKVPSVSYPGTISRRHYFLVHKLWFKALHKIYDRTDAHTQAIKDWSRDSWVSMTTGDPNNQSLDHHAFTDALFELVDIWTLTIEPAEYIHFLATLYHRVTRIKTWLADDGSIITKYVWRKTKYVKPSSVYRPYQYHKYKDVKWKETNEIIHHLDSDDSSDEEEDGEGDEVDRRMADDDNNHRLDRETRRRKYSDALDDEDEEDDIMIRDLNALSDGEEIESSDDSDDDSSSDSDGDSNSSSIPSSANSSMMRRSLLSGTGELLLPPHSPDINTMGRYNNSNNNSGPPTTTSLVKLPPLHIDPEKVLRALNEVNTEPPKSPYLDPPAIIPQTPGGDTSGLESDDDMNRPRRGPRRRSVIDITMEDLDEDLLSKREIERKGKLDAAMDVLDQRREDRYLQLVDNLKTLLDAQSRRLRRSNSVCQFNQLGMTTQDVDPALKSVRIDYQVSPGGYISISTRKHEKFTFITPLLFGHEDDDRYIKLRGNGRRRMSCPYDVASYTCLPPRQYVQHQPTDSPDLDNRYVLSRDAPRLYSEATTPDVRRSRRTSVLEDDEPEFYQEPFADLAAAVDRPYSAEMRQDEFNEYIHSLTEEQHGKDKAANAGDDESKQPEDVNSPEPETSTTTETSELSSPVSTETPIITVSSPRPRKEKKKKAAPQTILSNGLMPRDTRPPSPVFPNSKRSSLVYDRNTPIPSSANNTGRRSRSKQSRERKDTADDNRDSVMVDELLSPITVIEGEELASSRTNRSTDKDDQINTPPMTTETTSSKAAEPPTSIEMIRPRESMPRVVSRVMNGARGTRKAVQRMRKTSLVKLNDIGAARIRDEELAQEYDEDAIRQHSALRGGTMKQLYAPDDDDDETNGKEQSPMRTSEEYAAMVSHARQQREEAERKRRKEEEERRLLEQEASIKASKELSSLLQEAGDHRRLESSIKAQKREMIKKGKLLRRQKQREARRQSRSNSIKPKQRDRDEENEETDNDETVNESDSEVDDNDDDDEEGDDHFDEDYELKSIPEGSSKSNSKRHSGINNNLAPPGRSGRSASATDDRKGRKISASRRASENPGLIPADVDDQRQEDNNNNKGRDRTASLATKKDSKKAQAAEAVATRRARLQEEDANKKRSILERSESVKADKTFLKARQKGKTSDITDNDDQTADMQGDHNTGGIKIRQDYLAARKKERAAEGDGRISSITGSATTEKEDKQARKSGSISKSSKRDSTSTANESNEFEQQQTDDPSGIGKSSRNSLVGWRQEPTRSGKEEVIGHELASPVSTIGRHSKAMSWDKPSHHSRLKSEQQQQPSSLAAVSESTAATVGRTSSKSDPAAVVKAKRKASGSTSRTKEPTPSTAPAGDTISEEDNNNKNKKKKNEIMPVNISSAATGNDSVARSPTNQSHSVPSSRMSADNDDHHDDNEVNDNDTDLIDDVGESSDLESRVDIDEAVKAESEKYGFGKDWTLEQKRAYRDAEYIKEKAEQKAALAATGEIGLMELKWTMKMENIRRKEERQMRIEVKEKKMKEIEEQKKVRAIEKQQRTQQKIAEKTAAKKQKEQRVHERKQSIAQNKELAKDTGEADSEDNERAASEDIGDERRIDNIKGSPKNSSKTDKSRRASSNQKSNLASTSLTSSPDASKHRQLKDTVGRSVVNESGQAVHSAEPESSNTEEPTVGSSEERLKKKRAVPGQSNSPSIAAADDHDAIVPASSTASSSLSSTVMSSVANGDSVTKSQTRLSRRSTIDRAKASETKVGESFAVSNPSHTRNSSAAANAGGDSKREMAAKRREETIKRVEQMKKEREVTVIGFQNKQEEGRVQRSEGQHEDEAMEEIPGLISRHGIDLLSEFVEPNPPSSFRSYHQQLSNKRILHTKHHEPIVMEESDTIVKQTAKNAATLNEREMKMQSATNRNEQGRLQIREEKSSVIAGQTGITASREEAERELHQLRHPQPSWGLTLAKDDTEVESDNQSPPLPPNISNDEEVIGWQQATTARKIAKNDEGDMMLAIPASSTDPPLTSRSIPTHRPASAVRQLHTPGENQHIMYTPRHHLHTITYAEPSGLLVVDPPPPALTPSLQVDSNTNVSPDHPIDEILAEVAARRQHQEEAERAAMSSLLQSSDTAITEANARRWQLMDQLMQEVKKKNAKKVSRKHYIDEAAEASLEVIRQRIEHETKEWEQRKKNIHMSHEAERYQRKQRKEKRKLESERRHEQREAEAAAVRKMKEEIWKEQEERRRRKAQEASEVHAAKQLIKQRRLEAAEERRRQEQAREKTERDALQAERDLIEQKKADERRERDELAAQKAEQSKKAADEYRAQLIQQKKEEKATKKKEERDQTKEVTKQRILEALSNVENEMKVAREAKMKERVLEEEHNANRLQQIEIAAKQHKMIMQVELLQWFKDEAEREARAIVERRRMLIEEEEKRMEEAVLVRAHKHKHHYIIPQGSNTVALNYPTQIVIPNDQQQQSQAQSHHTDRTAAVTASNEKQKQVEIAEMEEKIRKEIASRKKLESVMIQQTYATYQQWQQSPPQQGAHTQQSQNRDMKDLGSITKQEEEKVALEIPNESPPDSARLSDDEIAHLHQFHYKEHQQHLQHPSQHRRLIHRLPPHPHSSIRNTTPPHHLAVHGQPQHHSQYINSWTHSLSKQYSRAHSHPALSPHKVHHISPILPPAKAKKVRDQEAHGGPTAFGSASSSSYASPVTENKEQEARSWIWGHHEESFELRGTKQRAFIKRKKPFHKQQASLSDKYPQLQPLTTSVQVSHSPNDKLDRSDNQETANRKPSSASDVKESLREGPPLDRSHVPEFLAPTEARIKSSNPLEQDADVLNNDPMHPNEIQSAADNGNGNPSEEAEADSEAAQFSEELAVGTASTV